MSSVLRYRYLYGPLLSAKRYSSALAANITLKDTTGKSGTKEESGLNARNIIPEIESKRSFDESAKIVSNASAKLFEENTDKKVSHIFDHLESVVFFQKLSTAKDGDYIPDSKIEDKFLLVKRKILTMVESRQFHQIVDLLLNLSKDENMVLSKVFSKNETSMILTSVFYFHEKLMVDRFYETKVSGIKEDHSQRFKYEEKLTSQIREIVSNLREFYQFEFSVTDYQNLLNFEIINLNLEKAAELIRIIEKKNIKINSSIWAMKFKVLSDGIPVLWNYKNEFYNSKGRGFVNSTQSPDKESILTMMHEFYSQDIPLTNEIIETIIYSLGNKGDSELLENYIHQTYGINENFKIDEKSKDHQVLDPDSVIYPNPSILKAIVTSFSYNNEFFKSLSYINAFQVYYPHLDLSKGSAVPFWFSLIKWAGMTTDFNRRKVAETVNLKGDFLEYEKKIETLKATRYSTLDKIWELYTLSNPVFDLNIYRLRINQLSKNNRVKLLKDLLPQILKEYKANSELSFYSQYHKIYLLFQDLCRAIIHIEFSYGYIKSIPTFIDDWAIDTRMKSNLTELYESKKVKFAIKTRKRADDSSRKQFSIDQEDDDNMFGF